MTNSIEDVCEQAQVILLVGSNPEEAHPVMGMRIRQAVERGAKLIVVDPRDIGLASKAEAAPWHQRGVRQRHGPCHYCPGACR